MDAFIDRHLQGVSRTYAIVIPMLPHGLDEAVGLAYLLMRIVDTLEDAPDLSDAERTQLLVAFDDVLARGAVGVPDVLRRPLGETPAERELMEQCDEVLRRISVLPSSYRESARACGRKMIAGVLMLMERARQRRTPYPAVRNAEELREYCYYVAGVVGEMLCEMMAEHLQNDRIRKLRDVAVELGTGLQLVNILKDSIRDSSHGRRYLPQVAGNVSAGEIYRLALTEARISLRRGAEFVLALPATAWRLRSFCGLPIAWGAMTLRNAERDAARGKITRSMIAASIEQFHALARDDQALRRWLVGLISKSPPQQLRA